MPSQGIQSHSTKGTFGSVIGPAIHEAKTHIIPHLCRAPNPPAVTVVEGWREGIPLKQKLLLEEPADRSLHCILGGFREW
jgi:hypothetical protein